MKTLALLAGTHSSLSGLSPRVRFSRHPFLLLHNHNASFRLNFLRSSPNFRLSIGAVRFDAPLVDAEESEEEECEFVVEMCIIRTLPPALTLEHGLRSIKEAVEELKLNPPSLSHGVLRFQVAVPPSPKALSWFCCLAESCGVFPLFFMSKETENPSFADLYLNRTRGVFGIGAAIYFTGGSGERRSSIRRYLSGDSMLVTSYGFLDASFDMELASIKHDSGSSYFLIPEIELNEQEDISILAATVAWNENLFCTLEEAIRSFESTIRQARCHFWSTKERYHSKCIRSALRKMKLVEDKSFRMASANALLLDSVNYQADTSQLVSPFS